MSPPLAADPARNLLVEGDRACRRLPGACLRHLGRAVWSADDGADALRTREREGGGFDLVLTCAEMDRVAGLRDELTRRRPGARVLLLTTSDDDGRGALPQPDSVAAVIETLAAALDGREASYGALVGGAAGVLP